MTSIDLSINDALSPAQRQRLAELLELYLEGMETGRPRTLESLVADDLELLEPLRDCARGLDALHELAQKDAAAVPSKRHRWLPGQLLDGFELVEEIGRGAMGVVYRARRITDNHPVAIKFLGDAVMVDPRNITRFLNEANVARELEHPNIVPTLSVGRADGVPYYVMRYIEGVSLEEKLAQLQAVCGQQATAERAMPDWRTMTKLAIEAADGLHAAHEQGVVHRDIKPSNLLLEKTGKLWIADFGLARCQHSTNLTQTGAILGTMRYMSPEQAKGESALVDGRADLYALGVTLYEMLCLSPAIEGSDSTTLLTKIQQGDVRPLQQHRQDLPRDLRAVVCKAIAVERELRYETAKEMAEDLRRVLSGRRTKALANYRWEQTLRLVRRHRRAALVASLIGALGVAGLATSTAAIATAKQASDSQAARARQGEALAREAIDKLGAGMAELLDQVPEAATIRQNLITETLAYYERLASNIGSDSDSVADAAVIQGMIGKLNAELGQPAKSVAAYTSAESLLAKLIQSSPTDTSLQSRLAITQANLARETRHLEEYEASAHWYGQAISNFESVIAVQSVDPDTLMLAKSQLTLTLTNVSAMLIELDADHEAELRLRRADAISSDEHAASPEQRQTILAYLSLALAKQQQSEAALEQARKAWTLLPEVLKNDTPTRTASGNIVSNLMIIGGASRAADNMEMAIEAYHRAVQIASEALQFEPNSLARRRQLVAAYNQLGISFADSGQIDHARDAFTAALRESEMFQTRPDVADLSRDLRASLVKNLALLDANREGTDVKQ